MWPALLALNGNLPPGTQGRWPPLALKCDTDLCLISWIRKAEIPGFRKKKKSTEMKFIEGFNEEKLWNINARVCLLARGRWRCCWLPKVAFQNPRLWLAISSGRTSTCSEINNFGCCKKGLVVSFAFQSNAAGFCCKFQLQTKFYLSKIMLRKCLCCLSDLHN